jgi:HME family heavy-metal exporter
MSATLLDTVLTPVLFLTFGKKSLERLAEVQVGLPTSAEAY